MTSVAILGGGVGGLSAAQELAQRGFEVTVYEARDVFGGKARSMPVPGSGTDGRTNLPAEHGFRFFPGFYRHITDTMKNIPGDKGTVYDHLTPCSEILMAQGDGRSELVAPIKVPGSLAELADGLRFLRDLTSQVGIPLHELAVFVDRILTMMTSCDERRLAEFEAMSWWDFVEAEHKSDAYKKFLATGMTRTLVAAKAEEMSARTGGTILCQLIYDILRLDGRLDNVLDGPTSEVWIDPWLEHLQSLGVTLQPECTVAGIHCEAGLITGVTIVAPDGDRRIEADHYIAALPVERFCDLVSRSMRSADPRLGLIRHLEYDWMNGVMFYLDTDEPLEHGHAIFIDSEWALTAISQKQFWPDIDLTQRGDGRVEGILSVDVSAWDVPGPVTGKVASACTKEEIRQEVWAQLVRHIDDGRLDESNVLSWFLDPAIEFPNPGKATNAEPLLVNVKCSWAHRPDAVTAIPNLFLAADFVRTKTDLATMEAANEAARAAVNGILEATGSPHSRCTIYDLAEPRILWPFRQLDRVLFRLGRRTARPPFRLTTAGALKPTGPLARAGLAALRVRGKGAFLAQPGSH
ncbi:hydroxysqualene dehydroxylase [Mycolicibacterium hippocampi]|uniref:Phytoene dehydrogenase n=1 Tax=Mycolicibacterium hippocampi TaxID=659824 RepID=A0A7I9ZKF5_9MYCO|nr:FAD-dependent oxidoreductase [Mycolicibacterium hippocampi]GFH01118.1 phytoene dehydrogenase [Mycolicibacterium hippocampi]